MERSDRAIREHFVANIEHIRIMRQGSLAMQAFLEANPGVKFDVSGADLSQIELTGASLSQAILRQANLSFSKLRLGKLSQADASKVDLSGANLCDANLTGADLSGADLTGADLSCATLYKANLNGAKLRGAILYSTDLRDANLSDTDLSDTNLIGANMSGASLHNADLGRADLTGADVSGARVDSNTSFRNLKSILRLKVDRSTVEYMFPDAATRGPKMMDMEVIDDLATLRGAFGGPVGFIYWLGLIAFLIPPLWFVCSQAVAAQTKLELASFVRQNPGLGHWVPAAGSQSPAISKPPQTIMLGTALLRFLWNGGIDWRNGWSLHYTFFLFCTGAVYRLASLSLLFDAMQRINEQTIRGTPAKFSFSMPFKVRVFWIPRWTIPLSTYGGWYRANRRLSIVAAIIAIVNLVHHMQMVIVVE
jgi:uncharacterized protein YjbI with pentapeptide repeats